MRVIFFVLAALVLAAVAAQWSEGVHDVGGGGVSARTTRKPISQLLSSGRVPERFAARRYPSVVE